MSVKFTRPAEQDLEEIGDWISQDDPIGAAEFIAELRAASKTLATHPRRYPVVAHRGDSEVRKMVHRRYLIFYRVRQGDVEVLRVAHGARDWGALMGEIG